MEYLDGINLKDFTANLHSNSDSELVNMEIIKNLTKCILAGLSYLHDNKIIHRDLKVSQNLKIARKYNPNI